MNGKPTVTWLGRLAHDLRGPMGPLQMAASMIAQPELDDGQKAELCKLVERQVSLLADMVDELADWASLSEGKLVARLEEADLECLLINAIDSLDAPLRRRVTLTAGVPTTIPADTSRLIQALKALIEARAALKPEETIAIGFTVLPDGMIELAIGAPTERSEILESVMDVPAPEGKKLGLALPIASAIVRAHAGRLTWVGECGEKVLTLNFPQYET